MGLNAGIVVVDKPEGLTSFGVVRRVRRILRVKKAGHTGTLDPIATGVLVVCVGKATRVIEYLDTKKEYVARIHLGITTDTGDSAGRVIKTVDVPDITREELEHLLEEEFTGEIEQIPPAFSAVKIQGERAYKLAREGKDVCLSPRKVFVHSLKLEEFSLPYITVRAVVDRGTYMRSLARDIGEAIGCGGCVSFLRRVRDSGFSIGDAVTLEEMEQGDYTVFPISRALAHLPVVQLNPEELSRFVRGETVLVGKFSSVGPVRVEDGTGEVMGIGVPRDGGLGPKKVFV